jgi:two-component system, NtrC family, sensor kinase
LLVGHHVESNAEKFRIEREILRVCLVTPAKLDGSSVRSVTARDLLCKRAVARRRTIRTRWLVASTLLFVALIGFSEYRNEVNRSEAALADLGAEQLAIARVVSSARATTQTRTDDAIGTLEQPGSVAVLTRHPGGVLEPSNSQFSVPSELAIAVGRHEPVVRLSPLAAPSLGFPERTAMVGIAEGSDGSIVAVARSAEQQRDRDRAGLRRVLLSIMLVAVVVSGFATIAWMKQRSEADLARELAVAEVARSRDTELERLSRAATMAALGSGVAHELSTPLGVIIGRAEQLLARSSDDRTNRAARTIIEQVDYIDRVVRGLLGLARGAPIALEAVAPEAVVVDTVALVEHRFQRKGIRLVPSIAGHYSTIRCEPLLLKHAIVNLLLNACDASTPGQTVELEIHADSAELAFVVTDEGGGIAASDVTRAIEPFFTTKPVGEGTGLGLAIANEIAKTHRGVLELAPRLPRGTRACIRIPIDEGPHE